MASTVEIPPNVDKGPDILIACSISVGVALVMVVLRLIVRLKVLRNVGWDDYFITAAMVGSSDQGKRWSCDADKHRRSCSRR